MAKTTKALYVRLEAKPDKVDEVEAFLNQGASMVDDEPETLAWFALRLGPTSFAIFDAFADDSSRDAHLNGQIAAALMENAPGLLAEDPNIEKIDVLADNFGGSDD